MVGRPREFDPDQALDAAMNAFWAKGYEATSLADLMSVTGLHKGSLYQAFGDKHSLFMQALGRYLAEMRKDVREVVNAGPTPKHGLRAMVHRWLDYADGDGDTPRGCLAVNSLVELAPHDDDVQEMLQNHIEYMMGMLVETIENGQAAGEFNKKRSAQLAASMLATFMLGLATNVKGQLTKAVAHRMLDAQLDAVL